VLARLRAAGRVRCPVAVVVGPLGGLGFWVQPGADLHLLNYVEALPEVEREAGPGKAVAVRPLVRHEFFAVPSRAEARAQLQVPEARRLVLISGGGWGAGDLEGAIEAALAVAGAHVTAVAGRNEPLREAIARRHAGDDRVTVMGFTDQMREWLAAADAFVTATAGLSCLEAQLCGCQTVWYGFAAGHVRDNVAALAARGLALSATSPAELTVRLEEALSTSAVIPAPARDQLPRGGDVLVALARDGGSAVHSETFGAPEIAQS
jgi:UDP-N-acetylglucosamine:LPS N-acetylglucosamine transferase